ncbi:MAG: uracil-DNA glycosylase [Bacteroidota bacterium]|jgi:uracil-DNA glycosylase
MTIKMEESWKEQLKDEFEKPYFLQLVDHLKAEKALNRQIYPAGNNIFKAFEKTPFDQVKLVILGQDPYHGPNQAHGLSFSVQDGVAIPRSLKNIFKELQSDIGISIPTSGNLTAWAEKGVLLLNASLTVRANEPASHAQIGWLTFTDAVISTLSANKKDLVFLLWGKFAQEKQLLIDGKKHFVLKAAHPSPFSAEKGFFGCKHFSKSNEYLMQKGYDPIDWKL